MSKRLWILLFLLFIIGVGFLSLSKLKFNTELSELQLANRQDIEKYEDLTLNYPKLAESGIVILKNDEGFKTRKDFIQIQKLTEYIEDLEEVESVSSITNLMLTKQKFLSLSTELYLDLSSENNYKKWLSQYDLFNDINEKFISKDKCYSLLYLNTDKGLTQAHIDELSIWSANNLDFETTLIQKDIIESDAQAEWIKETIILGLICTILILISFYLFTNSFRGLFLILLFVLFNFSATIIFMVGFGIEFNIQMIALPCLILLFSFTDIMHILYHHALLIPIETDLNKLRKKLIKTLKSALFLTSFSNLFGFLIFLIISDNQIITELLIVTIFIIIISYLSGRFLVIPLILNSSAMIKSSKIDVIQKSIVGFTSSRFWLNKSKALISIVSILIIFIILDVNQFEINGSNALESTENSEYIENQMILNKKFFGSKSIEILVNYDTPNSIWKIDNLKKIDSLEEELETILSPHFIASPTTIVKRFNRFQMNGNPHAFKIPNSYYDLTESNLSSNFDSFGGSQFVSKNGKQARIIVGFDEDNLNQSLNKYETIKAILTKYSNQNFQLELNGKSYLVDSGIFTFTKQLIIGWFLGVLIISITLAFYLKSILKGFIVLAVNLLPLLIVVFIMPFFNLQINPQSLFLLSILAGLSVDDSIYLIMNRVNKKENLSYYPILVTSCVLAAGFLAFSFSTYSWLSPFSWIFIIGIGLAFMFDLFVLPLFMFNDKNQDV